MNENLYIPKSRTLPQSQDFHFLRSEGLKYIEALAHELWTDYNTHDPGVTILEALCYAITELGYRSDFDMKDLLADKDGKVDADQTFYSPKTIFRNNPLTVEDYRKILIDSDGIHNAFMFPSVNVEDENAENIPVTEVPFYPDCKKDALVYTATDHAAIDVRGLYKVLLDLDATDEFGDLNIGNVFYSLRTPALIGVNVEAILPPWREMDLVFPGKIIANITNVTAAAIDADSWQVDIEYTDGGSLLHFIYTVRKTLTSKIANAGTLIISELTGAATQQTILDLYSRKLAYINTVLNESWKKLQIQRNLCEDFISIDTVEYTGIAVCADIEILAQYDIEEILGNVYFLIQEYLSPTINFYLLEEMIAKGKTTDQIFEGPSSLQHGFIDTDELIAAQLRSEIRVSDIISLIQDIPGVVAVKNVLLSSYDDKGKLIKSGEKWCLHIAPYHKPVLDIFRSKVLFFKNRLPFNANQTEAVNVLRLLQANRQRPKLKGHIDDLEMPRGTFYQSDDYLTVQYELPQTYGISEYGLSKEMSYQRKAQALQLRAYLMFYDQLLADFFSQLYHAKDLFSLNTGINKTYFTQFLTGIKDIEKIYRDTDLKQVPGHHYSLEEVMNAPVKINPADIDYTQKLWLNKLHEQLIESAGMFDDRRNRFLDHLVARFGETFNNYVFLLYTADKEKIADEELINSKILFLQDYPIISAERGKAFNYLNDTWNTDNVSGLEKRVSRFTGIKDYTARNLFCLPGFVITPAVNGTATQFSFGILDTDKNIVLASVENYATTKEAENILNEVYDRMTDKNNYKIFKAISGDFIIQLFDIDGCCIIAQAVKAFTNNLTAAAYLKTLVATFQSACNAEGMHLVEHLLLRPHFPPAAVPVPEDDYKLMQVCLEKNCMFCGEEDPYSFRVSVFLPYWPQRFRDMDFRRYIEEIFETEAPAHIAVKVCWLSYTSMQKFEFVFSEWLAALKDYETDLKKTDETKQTKFKEANNKMIEIMANVHSEYPLARLHDCDTGVSNPVRLGSTVLGTF